MSKNSVDEIPNDVRITSWEKGVSDFNEGRFWQAHEKWEFGWRSLQTPEKEYVQALIQACAVFHLLLEKSRVDAARTLCRSALGKLAMIPSGYMKTTTPRLEIPGLEGILLEIEKKLSEDPHSGTSWVGPTVQDLKAHLVR